MTPNESSAKQIHHLLLIVELMSGTQKKLHQANFTIFIN